MRKEKKERDLVNSSLELCLMRIIYHICGFDERPVEALTVWSSDIEM